MTRKDLGRLLGLSSYMVKSHEREMGLTRVQLGRKTILYEASSTIAALKARHLLPSSSQPSGFPPIR